MNGETRSNQGYAIIESCTSGIRSLSSGITRKPRTRMYVGTAKAATTITGAVTATPLKLQGKS